MANSPDNFANTIFLLCGPSGCGKSTWTQSFYSKINSKVLVLSSDAIRRQVLDKLNEHKHSAVMSSASDAAFTILTTTLRAMTTYPASLYNPLIIIDSTAFSTGFRSQIINLGKEAGYKVVLVKFDFRKTPDYFVGITDEGELQITRDHVERFRRKVLPELRVSDYDAVIKVKSKDECLNINMPLNLKSDVVVLNKPGTTYAIIGDIHECVDEATELLFKAGNVDQVIYLGDYLDKGGNTERMIEFMEDRQGRGDIIIVGNHEQYLYNQLTGQGSPAPKDVEETYFTALPVLRANPDLAERFINLFESSVHSVIIEREGKQTIIATHAPCDTKYLGKSSFEAKRAQRNLYIKDRTEDGQSKTLAQILAQGNYNHPYHVFGHLSHAPAKVRDIFHKNQVFLDTGCVHSGALTAMLIGEQAIDFTQVEAKSDLRCPATLPKNLTKPVKAEKKFNIDDYSLSIEDQRLLRGIMSNNVKYISGTMSPGPSTSDSLESLEGAFDFLRKRGVTEVSMQRKYMGSRAQVYLYKDPAKESFAVSRRGYKIKYVPFLDAYLEEMKEVLAERIQWEDELILDAELLPWSAMGRGLIEDSFEEYSALIKQELEELSSDPEFAKLDCGCDFDAKERLNIDLAKFKETLALYAQDTSLEIKPFNILSIDGKSPSVTPREAFVTINGDGEFYVNLNDEENVENAKKEYARLAYELGFEGVVLKPNVAFQDLPEGVAEYMKVRNEDYLTLVYGYDYRRPERLKELIKQKNISGKYRTSIRESQYGRKMLLSTTEDERKEFAVKMIGEMNRESELDPRL